MEIKKGLNCNPATGINNSKRSEHEYIESVMVLPSLDQSWGYPVDIGASYFCGLK